MRRLLEILACLGLLSPLAGCFQADVGAVLFEDGRGKFDIVLSVNRNKLPGMFGDPLEGVGEVEDLRRYTSRGITAWAEPTRIEAGGWERVQLTAFFDDINELRFLRRRGEEGVELLGFDYDARTRPGHLAMRVDMEPELAEPLPLPEREGLDEGVLRQLLGMFKPMMGDLQLSLSFRAPGAIHRASGFSQIEGDTALILAERDLVFEALQQEAGALLDRRALLAEGAAIEWAPAGRAAKAERAQYESDREAAGKWWESVNSR